MIKNIREGPADAVVFTDGSCPEPGDPPGTKPTVGSVLFSEERADPAGFILVVPEHLIKTWLPRKNQIALIELFGAVAAVAILISFCASGLLI